MTKTVSRFAVTFVSVFSLTNVLSGCTSTVGTDAMEPVYEFRAGLEYRDADYACDQLIWSNEEFGGTKEFCMASLDSAMAERKTIPEARNFEYSVVPPEGPRRTVPPTEAVVKTVYESGSRKTVTLYSVRLVDSSWKIESIRDESEGQRMGDPYDLDVELKKKRPSV